MKTRKSRKRRFALQEYGIIRRFCVSLIFWLFIGYRYKMLVTLALIPIAIILLSNAGYHPQQQYQWLFEYGPLWIIIAIVWVPICILLGMRLMNWLSKYEVAERFA